MVCKKPIYDFIEHYFLTLNHQPVLKFPNFFPVSLQAKTAEISKLVDDEAGSILVTKETADSFYLIKSVENRQNILRGNSITT